MVGLNTRRYHGLLTAATKPPVGRFVLLSKVEDTLDCRREALRAERRTICRGASIRTAINTSARFDSIHSLCSHIAIGRHRVEEIDLSRPWREHRRDPVRVIRRPGRTVVRLEVRPLVAFRDYHNTTHANARSGAKSMCNGLRDDHALRRTPQPALRAQCRIHRSGGFWFYNFEYDRERERGLDYLEDLYSHFLLRFNLARNGRPRSLPQQPSTTPPKRVCSKSRRWSGAKRSRERRAVRRSVRDTADVGGRSVHRRARRPENRHRRLPLVRRLGPRHDDLAARPHARRQAGTTKPATSCAHSPAACRSRHAAQSVSRTRARRRNTTPSTRRCGCSTPFTNSLRYTDDYDFVRAEIYRALADSHRLARARNALRHPARLRRPAHRRRAGRATHLDGRQGRRLGGHAAPRQAGGDSGALVQRAARDAAPGRGFVDPRRRPATTRDLAEPCSVELPRSRSGTKRTVASTM